MKITYKLVKKIKLKLVKLQHKYKIETKFLKKEDSMIIYLNKLIDHCNILRIYLYLKIMIN